MSGKILSVNLNGDCWFKYIFPLSGIELHSCDTAFADLRWDVTSTK